MISKLQRSRLLVTYRNQYYLLLFDLEVSKRTVSRKVVIDSKWVFKQLKSGVAKLIGVRTGTLLNKKGSWFSFPNHVKTSIEELMGTGNGADYKNKVVDINSNLFSKYIKYAENPLLAEEEKKQKELLSAEKKTPIVDNNKPVQLNLPSMVASPIVDTEEEDIKELDALDTLPSLDPKPLPTSGNKKIITGITKKPSTVAVVETITINKQQHHDHKPPNTKELIYSLAINTTVTDAYFRQFCIALLEKNYGGNKKL